MRKPKVSVNWEEVKLYFLHPTEERNLLPPRQRQFSVAMLQWPVDLLVAKDWTLQDFQCVYDKNKFIWERFFGDQNFFYGNHFTIEGRQKATFWKSELGALHLHIFTVLQIRGLIK